eukprot:scaffold1233_cov111-Cylindrotheca_fusiformis.AAC.2
MPREKRKTRLDKGESGDFIGFAAFAAPGTTAPTSSAASTGPSVTLSPIYTGSDGSLGILFPRIGQKRDATTKAKALGELRDYFADSTKPRKAQVDALSHFCYLYHSKLHYDHTARVRASCLECFLQASRRLPKAWKTICEEQQPEIIGMITCSRADPASDVRIAANELVDSLLSADLNVVEGTWDYVKRILSYGKSKAMHEELFQKKDATSALSEKQKEELEERFERIVGTAIGGMQLFFQQNFDNETFNASDDIKVLWKALSSPKPSLRRKTFALMATAYQKAPALLDNDKTSKLILQSLSAEKEPSNIPPLLETLISFVASFPQEERSSTMALYTKPLSKLFKKGCYGATQWAPTVLPIVAILPMEEQSDILTCVWEGRNKVSGLSEELEIVGAVAETATFLLTKSPHEFSEVIAKCWLHSVQAYLTTHGTGPAQRSARKLSETIAKDWNQLNHASSQKQASAIFQLKEWFWDEELPKLILRDNVENQQLLTLLKLLEVKDQDTPNLWAPTMKQKFHKLLVPCQGSSGLLPSADVYELWIAMLNGLSVNQLFEKTELDKFVMNDLLRWMIIHTSSVSDQASQESARYDFSVYRLCRSMTNSGVWDAILRELVASKCDLEYLEAGLTAMLELGGDVESVRSPILNEFCIRVANEAIESEIHHIEEASELQHDHFDLVARFLQTCVGLGNFESVLPDDCVAAWVDSACPEDSFVVVYDNPVLETLVLLAKKEGRLGDEGIRKVFVQSWRQGGELWQDSVVPWVSQTSDLGEVVDVGSKELKAMLNHAFSESQTEDGSSRIWSERANRLLQLCQHCSLPSSQPNSTLSLVGMADSELWKSNEGKGSNSYVSQCLLKLLSQIDSVADRKTLFWNFDSDHLELFMNLLMGLSGAGTDILGADLARRREDACATVLTNVGVSSIEISKQDNLCNTSISSLSSILKEGSVERICRGISVLSQLVGFRFHGLRPEGLIPDQRCNLDQLKRGDIVWYITNAEDPLSRQECTVVKVHSDLPSEVYFTIKITKDGSVQERQTVGDRLRSGPWKGNYGDSHLTSAKDISSEEKSQRETLAQHLLRELIVSHWEQWTPHAFELVSVVISQCGFLGSRGVGTDHYMLLQKMMNLEAKLVESFKEPSSNEDTICASLQELSFSLGYGCNVPSASSQALLGFSPFNSVKAIVDFYNNMETDPHVQFDFAVSLWLTVSAASLEDKVLRMQAFSLLFQLSCRIFEHSKESKVFDSDQFVALRCIQAAQQESHNFKSGESILEDAEAEALGWFIKAFACQWEAENMTDPDVPPAWSLVPHFNSVFESSLVHRLHLMARAARPCMNQLIECLYADSKRIYSMKLLFSYAKEGEPLQSEPGELNELTAGRMDQWCVQLIDEEIEELEDDVDAVAQWIPRKLMNDVESWFEEDGDFILDPDSACSRFLSWIAFCRIAKTAGGKDSMNRSSFASYATKCKAVDTILNLAMVYGNVGTERKMKLEKYTDIDDILDSKVMELSKLAALTIFNTIEVFPMIAKNWWEMVCPNYATQAVREFVESTVSPEILRRELERMKQTLSFGEMNVKGSLMSREVAATYVQDEFTLSVVIKMPDSFPFRRAEVDCSKTYGVPESRWKRWALQITQMLNNQGGTLSDALLLWKENVDKEFEGVEPCPVCYSVLHVKTHKLPGVECNTCQNRFHIDCLSQWFRSSGKNDCVLCQQPWSGTRVV